MQGTRAVQFGFRVFALPFGLVVLAVSLLAQNSAPQFPQEPSQQKSSSSSSSSGTSSSSPNPTPAEEGLDLSSESTSNAQQKPPAVVDPTGPATSLETSESLFSVMAALNTCGYNEGLSSSDPVRQQVRDDINQALEQSEPARQSRDKLCGFIRTHTLHSNKLNLAAYISLALFLTPPPALTPNVAPSDLPPDAAPLVDLPPYIRDFSQAVGLHLIWVLHHPEYEAAVTKAHKPLADMLIQTDLYLKQPPASYGPRRFLVILEPMIAPGEVNARVYGGDYIVVESPVNGTIDLKPVKHTYLRFVLEPLIYARSTAIDKLTPILELVQPSPLSYEFKSDVLTLVTECMIRAIEAHTMDTGVPVYKVPAHVARNQLAAVNSAENAYEHKVETVRREKVHSDMLQGFILTKYLYQEFQDFENRPTTLQEAVGEMIYGMNVDIEKRRVEKIVFASHTDQDVVKPVAPSSAMLDEGEQKLIAGDTAGAAALAQQALAAHTDNPGRAQFLLARADIMSGKMEAAEQAFTDAAKISHNLRTIAWSHIYLGRMADLQGDRDTAIAEYQAAMKTRDGKTDTEQAAQSGLKAPFAPPHAEQH
ncbi:MAG: hypothetical protein ABI164_02610 [Acidobacteriaceae bacterium]